MGLVLPIQISNQIAFGLSNRLTLAPSLRYKVKNKYKRVIFWDTIFSSVHIAWCRKAHTCVATLSMAICNIHLNIHQYEISLPVITQTWVVIHIARNNRSTCYGCNLQIIVLWTCIVHNVQYVYQYHLTQDANIWFGNLVWAVI